MTKNPHLEPLGDRVLIRPPAVEQITDSGIHLAGLREEKHAHGTVVSVGADCELALAAGDRVYFPPFAGVELEYSGEKLRFLVPSDLLGVERVDELAAGVC